MDDTDFYAATPHPQTEGYKAFEELLSRINEVDENASKDKRNDASESESELMFSDLKIGKESPVLFSPIRRAMNPMPLNSPFDKMTFENDRNSPLRRVIGQEIRVKSVSPLVLNA